MKKWTIWIAMLVLSGCATAPPVTVPQARQFCEKLAFEQFGSCMQDAFNTKWPNWRVIPEGDLLNIYFSWIDAAAIRVGKGEMEEADARLGAATLETRLREMANERRAQAAYNQQLATDRLITGLALLNSAYSPPQGYVAPNAPITCTTYPTNRVYGQTQTVCR